MSKKSLTKQFKKMVFLILLDVRFAVIMNFL